MNNDNTFCKFSFSRNIYPDNYGIVLFGSNTSSEINEGKIGLSIESYYVNCQKALIMDIKDSCIRNNTECQISL